MSLVQFLRKPEVKKEENPKTLFPNLTKAKVERKPEAKSVTKFVPRVEKKVNRVINVRKGK